MSKTDWNEVYSETGHGIGWVIMVVGVVVALLCCITYFWLAQRPTMENMYTEGTRQTNQYRTTKDTEMVTYIDEWNRNQIAKNKLDPNSQAYTDYVTAQKSLVRRVKKAADMIGREKCSSTVKEFLLANEKDLE